MFVVFFENYIKIKIYYNINKITKKLITFIIFYIYLFKNFNFHMSHFHRYFN